jgi:SAM-dependent methyltransferase
MSEGFTAYWDSLADDAQFTHPINDEWITKHSRESFPLLDYGCGYGRTLGHLEQMGYFRLFGVDPSENMIARARREAPTAELHTINDASTMFAPESFVMVLLVAVLTCVPDSDAQRAIIDEVKRVLAPGGYLYLSDFMLQTDDRNLARYQDFADRGYRYGVFDIDDGKATMRHHDPDYFDQLLTGFDLVDRDTFELKTMKGNPAVGTRMLLRKVV